MDEGREIDRERGKKEAIERSKTPSDKDQKKTNLPNEEKGWL